MQTLAESHRIFLVDKVRQHYEKFDKPLLLSDLGTLFAHEFGRVSSHYDTSLRELVEGNLKEEVAIVSHPHIAQKLYVAPIDKLAAATEFAMAGSVSPCPNERPSDVTDFDLSRLQRAILVAFQIAPENGKSVYVTSTPPFRFIIRSDPPTAYEKLVPIEPEFSLRLPKPKRPDELSVDQKADLSARIVEWAQEHSLDLKRFYFTGKASASSSRAQAHGGTTALERLIDAQPEDVKRRLLIPADIVQQLLSGS